MPRRGRSASPPPAPRRMQASRPAPPPPRQSLPAAPPAQTPMVAPPASQGPGLLGQMAATAGGVAIGSTIGHVAGSAITGMFSGGGKEEVQQAPPAQSYQPSGYGGTPLEQNGPCSFEIKQFLHCAENQSELSFCEGFKEAMNQCKLTHRI